MPNMQIRIQLSVSIANDGDRKAVAFYEKYGFRGYCRSETDNDGICYPLLNMELKKQQI